MRLKKFVKYMVIAMPCTAAFLFVFSVAVLTLSPAAPITTVPTTAPTRSVPPATATPVKTPIVKNLGIQPSAYGSKWQAQEIMGLIRQNVDAPRVTIIATDQTGARVELTADLEADQLSRTHGGSTERWQGQIVRRLTNAADGGSLNNPN